MIEKISFWLVVWLVVSMFATAFLAMLFPRRTPQDDDDEAFGDTTGYDSTPPQWRK